jgi:hyperosmotically inducible periplasmic protein
LKHKGSRQRIFLSGFAAVVIAMLVIAGCNRADEHADVKDTVNSAMTQNGLGVVDVSQDREKGVLTLSGDVETQDKKAQAEEVAKQAAPGYAISNQIGVRPVGQESQAKSVDSNLDDGIENNYKAAIKAHNNLDDQSIHFDAKNGTLVLKGSVKTAAQKKEAMTLAKNVANVKEVVNELEVKPDKGSTAN